MDSLKPKEDIVKYLFEQLENNRVKIALLEEYNNNLELELKDRNHEIDFLVKTNHLWYLSTASFLVHFGILWVARINEIHF